MKGSNDFTIPFNRQELADYLGVERSAMSAELGKLTKLGILQTQRSHFTLLKPLD
jgi:predicted transcriptional regulator